MKALLSIVMFVVLSYCDNDTPSYAAMNRTTTTSYNESRPVNMTTTEITTTQVIPLLCHVCSDAYLCEAPKTCKLTDKYCVIVINVDDQATSILKYCSETCPFGQELRGRQSQSYYTGCCVTNLCNFGKIGEGHKLGASIPVVAMALVVVSLGPSGLDCDILR